MKSVDSKEIIKELREWVAKEKAVWTEHREKNKIYGPAYSAYGGRVWMLGVLQEKLKTISRRKGFSKK